MVENSIKIIKYLTFSLTEFAKSRAMRAKVVYVPTRLRASVVYVPTRLRASVVYVPKACRLLILTYRCAIRRANVSTWRAKVPNGLPIFQLGVPMCQFFKHSYEMLKEISVLYDIKNSALYLIS